MEKEKSTNMPVDSGTTEGDKGEKVNARDWEKHLESAKRLLNKEKESLQAQANIEASRVEAAEELTNKPTQNEVSFLFAGPIKN